MDEQGAQAPLSVTVTTQDREAAAILSDSYRCPFCKRLSGTHRVERLPSTLVGGADVGPVLYEQADGGKVCSLCCEDQGRCFVLRANSSPRSRGSFDWEKTATLPIHALFPVDWYGQGRAAAGAPRLCR